MTKTDLSTEALLVRREIAEKATPGPWEKMFETAVGTDNGHQVPLRIASTNFESDASHIVANSPDVVIATIDELLRLRAELEQYKDSIQSLRYVANKALVDCNFRIKENISLKEEVLRIQAENARLKEGLENALHVNGLRLAEVAKTLFTGMVEEISGDSESVRVQTGATCVHCNACFTSADEVIAHDKVCPKHPANIRAELLEKEADWLANRLACIQSARDIEPQTRDQNPEWWREAARKAVEES